MAQEFTRPVVQVRGDGEQPTYGDMIETARHLLTEALDVLRSDWKPGSEPEQVDPHHSRSEAVQLISQAKVKLEQAKKGAR